ncbi:MAG: TIGR03790 family protein [Acidobacteriia bacterium]|nr:TIGR03790 family protein [Terriglobia bacterium]
MKSNLPRSPPVGGDPSAFAQGGPSASLGAVSGKSSRERKSNRRLRPAPHHLLVTFLGRLRLPLKPQTGKIKRMRRRIPIVVVLASLVSVPAFAQGPENVLLVVNQSSRISKAVGTYYRSRRAVPTRQVCSIKTWDEEEIDRAIFDKEIRRPILDCLERGGLQDRILYIVLAKGVPLKIKDSDEQGDHASVDSELTLLYQDLLGIPRVLRGSIPNPYFAGSRGGQFVRFSHREFPIYLVTRLDGYDLADVRALIDRSLAPARDGRFVLDLSRDDNATGNDWLREAAAKLLAAGIPASRIVLDTSERFVAGEKEVLGYASWGSNDSRDYSRFLANTWVNGALLVEFVSTDARTFEKPPAKWTIGKWSDPPITFFAGSPQSLIADYLHQGVTGAAGYVYEPYLAACVRPQFLFPAYVRGLNLAESYYSAIPSLSWQTVVVGDPLTTPFPGTPLPRAEADPPTDPATGLPTYFSRFSAGTKLHREEAHRVRRASQLS